jgi:hypothetical protein
MTDGMDLPLAMLATSVTFRPDGTATLSGVWYLLKSKLPGTGDERLMIPADLASRACVLVEVIGTQRQIAELLMLATAAEAEDNATEAIVQMRLLLETLTSAPMSHHDFDNVHNPRGTSLPIDFPVRVDADFPSLKKAIFSHPDLIRLQLLSGWSLWDDTQLPL